MFHDCARPSPPPPRYPADLSNVVIDRTPQQLLPKHILVSCKQSHREHLLHAQVARRRLLATSWDRQLIIRTGHCRNRALSIRSNKSSGQGNSSGAGRKGFSFASLRGAAQPELSRKLFRLIKSTNNLISHHEAAGKERVSIATQLSEWGEQTGDDGVSDISDKVGVILSEIGEVEEAYAHNLDEGRGVLKAIRNTEKSVQPSRDNKDKIADEIQKLKFKEPQSTRLVVLENELVRAEAENLVAEAQLSNVVSSNALSFHSDFC